VMKRELKIDASSGRSQHICLGYEINISSQDKHR
jgi:hypothetical protein